MRRLTYTDQNGISYVLNDDISASLVWNGLRGFGMPRLSLATQRVPYQSGAALLGAPYMAPREMRVALDVSKATFDARIAYERTLRRNLSPFKDTDSLGTLTVQDTGNSVTRAIDCWLVEAPDPDEQGPFASTVVLTFFAPDPFFYDPTVQTENLALAGDSGITFPITFPITFGSTTIDSYVYPNNQGDVETWPTIRVNGPGANIELTNDTTGKTLALTTGGGVTLDVGDYVTIDMAEATVTWYDATDGSTTSVIEKLSDASEFWPLVRGVNAVHGEMTATVSGSIVFSYYLYYQSGG